MPRPARGRTAAWFLLGVFACAVAWYVSTHDLQGVPERPTAPATEQPAAAGGAVPTLAQVEALRMRASALWQEAWGYLLALDTHAMHADDAYRDSLGGTGPRVSRPTVPAWERELRGILTRLDMERGAPGSAALKRAEDALMRSDAREAARGFAAAQDDVRTWEGYLERVRKHAAENGLQR